MTKGGSMEINIQFIIDIAPIVLLIIIIFQLKEFRDTWWKEWIARGMLDRKELIDQIIHDFYQYKCDVITASHKLDQVDFINPNSVKVYAKKGYADNFCRLPAKSRDYQKHVGIYGYCFKTLKQIVSLEPTANEKEHKLEQLRFMDNGMSIYVSEYNENIVPGIDTQDDLNNAIEYLKNNED